MKFSIRFSDQIVGTLVILAIAMLIFVVFMLGTSQRWFMRDQRYVTYFPSASGLSTDMPIQYRGFTIGHVKKISLAENDEVEVIFQIFEEHIKRVKEGSLVEVQVSPIGLGSSFIFHPGLGEEEVPEGTLIPRINSPEAKALAAAGLVGRTDSGTDNINAIVNQVNALLETLNVSFSGSTGADQYPLGQILENLETITNDIAEYLKPVLDNVETISVKAADPSGTIMEILDAEGPVYTGLSQAITSLAGIIKSLDETAEFIPAQLPQLGILISQLNVSLNTMQDLLISISNHPLLRGGIPERKESGPGGASPRNMEF